MEIIFHNKWVLKYIEKIEGDKKFYHDESRDPIKRSEVQ